MSHLQFIMSLNDSEKVHVCPLQLNKNTILCTRSETQKSASQRDVHTCRLKLCHVNERRHLLCPCIRNNQCFFTAVLWGKRDMLRKSACFRKMKQHFEIKNIIGSYFCGDGCVYLALLALNHPVYLQDHQTAAEWLCFSATNQRMCDGYGLGKDGAHRDCWCTGPRALCYAPASHLN